MNIFWFRRDLRLHDNTALFQAFKSGLTTLPLFIFDDKILNQLEANDARVSFIYDELEKLNSELMEFGSGIKILKGNPIEVIQNLISEYQITSLYFNKDYEPYALKRDQEVTDLCIKNSLQVHAFKDQLIFEPGEVLKADGAPYTVYTPYKNKWLEHFETSSLEINPFENIEKETFYQFEPNFPSRDILGIKESDIKVVPFDLSVTSNYHKNRDFPDKNGTSRLGPHLRFGTVSVREMIIQNENTTFRSELIWREFFMQILYHYPKVVSNNFRSKYDRIQWRNNEEEFKKWCEGKTGYPMVDAGMRELNTTGYMHNRVRMITAGFLCKHLLIDWRWGEAYFASKLLDFELASNNGNWQWAAGTGCDAAPYFRVFNPITQQKKFDPRDTYVKKWVPEYGTKAYQEPIVDHKFGRERAINTYKSGVFDV